MENHNKDFDLRAIGFLLLGEYDFKKEYPNLPINAAMSIAVAPSPLSSSDTRRYLEYSSTIYFYIVKNAAIGVGYRAFDAHFDDTSGRIKRSEDAVFFGFRLDF